MKVVGLKGMSVAQLVAEVQEGGKFVVFRYVISVGFMTFRRGSRTVFYIPPGRSATVHGLPYSLVSFLLGWWGFPWGIIYTPGAIADNIRGKDVTTAILQQLLRT